MFYTINIETIRYSFIQLIRCAKIFRGTLLFCFYLAKIESVQKCLKTISTIFCTTSYVLSQRYRNSRKMFGEYLSKMVKTKTAILGLYSI